MESSKFENIPNYTYEDLKNNLKTGDILLCSGEYIVSDLIKKISDSMFSHVGLIAKWHDQILVIESVEDDGVRVVPLKHYLDNYENRSEGYKGSIYIGRHNSLENLDEGDEKLKNIVRMGLNLLNRQYDRDEIAHIVARIALGIGNHKDDDEYICSEFVYECFKKVGINFKIDPKGFIFPKHIANDPEVKAIARIK